MVKTRCSTRRTNNQPQELLLVFSLCATLNETVGLLLVRRKLASLFAFVHVFYFGVVRWKHNYLTAIVSILYYTVLPERANSILWSSFTYLRFCLHIFVCKVVVLFLWFTEVIPYYPILLEYNLKQCFAFPKSRQMDWNYNLFITSVWLHSNERF